MLKKCPKCNSKSVKSENSWRIDGVTYKCEICDCKFELSYQSRCLASIESLNLFFCILFTVVFVKCDLYVYLIPLFITSMTFLILFQKIFLKVLIIK
jgi:hypothetical protein